MHSISFLFLTFGVAQRCILTLTLTLILCHALHPNPNPDSDPALHLEIMPFELQIVSHMQTSCEGVSQCAEGEGDTCACKGTVYYGRKFADGKPGSGAVTSLEQMMTTGNRNNHGVSKLI